MDEKTEKEEHNTVLLRALIHDAYDAPCADCINKYEHIGLREGMYDACEKRNRTFNVDRRKSRYIIINVARKVCTNFTNRALCDEIQFENI